MPFDVASYILGQKAGGGGSSVTVESLSVIQNGTYEETGKAYSPVVVDVPNTYTAGDEGKVVSNGALVAQTAHAEVTQNGTVDTTLNNSVVVNVATDPNENINKVAAGTLAIWNAKGLTYLKSLRYNTGLVTVVFPDVNSIDSANGNNFSSNINLETIDCGVSWPKIPANFINADAKLTTIILRTTSVVPLLNVNGLGNNSTPFKTGGTGGTIYIPKTLYDHLGDNSASDYKAASNWADVDARGTITWAKIEGSIYENAYADGTPIA